MTVKRLFSLGSRDLVAHDPNTRSHIPSFRTKPSVTFQCFGLKCRNWSTSPALYCQDCISRTERRP